MTGEMEALGNTIVSDWFQEILEEKINSDGVEDVLDCMISKHEKTIIKWAEDNLDMIRRDDDTENNQ